LSRVVDYVTVEPRVEELLATIRKAIDNDISQLDKAQGLATAGHGVGGSMREMRLGSAESSADQELTLLRDRVGRQKIDQRVSLAAPVAPPPRPAERAAPRINGVSGILSGAPIERGPRNIPRELLRPSYVDDLPEREPQYDAQSSVPAQEAHWAEETPPPMPQPYYPPAQQGGALMSPQAAYSAQASFQALADSMFANLGGERQLQEMAQELLRPMLKQWLDSNLPPLVERLVREEIERVARRGR
jgi:cell pole-organizing protein PopZ